MDHYVKGNGFGPRDGCRRPTPRPAPATRPPAAPTWRRTGPASRPARSATTRASRRRSPPTPAIRRSPQKFNPVGGGACCDGARAPISAGAANYRLDAAPRSGYTLLGSATVIADFEVDQRHLRARGAAARRRPRRPGDARLARHCGARDERPDERRSSSCIRTAGASPPATCRSWSCCPRTPTRAWPAATAGPPNEQDPITSRTSSCGSRSPSSRARSAGSSARRRRGSCRTGYELAADFAGAAEPSSRGSRSSDLKREGLEGHRRDQVPEAVRLVQRRRGRRQGDEEEVGREGQGRLGEPLAEIKGVDDRQSAADGQLERADRCCGSRPQPQGQRQDQLERGRRRRPARSAVPGWPVPAAYRARSAPAAARGRRRR